MSSRIRHPRATPPVRCCCTAERARVMWAVRGGVAAGQGGPVEDDVADRGPQLSGGLGQRRLERAVPTRQGPKGSQDLSWAKGVSALAWAG